MKGLRALSKKTGISVASLIRIGLNAGWELLEKYCEAYLKTMPK